MRESILKVLLDRDTYISGEVLSKELGVSRTAIWKAINKLKEEGYEITSVRNKGYLLTKESQDLNEEGIKVHLNDSSRFRNLKIYEVIDSTNTEAKRLKMDGKMEEGLVLAHEQSAGKGRRGRLWVSDKNDGIWASMVLVPEINPSKASMLTLIAGLAVARSITKLTSLEAKIKWPNDIVVNGKKVCGILTEMSAQLDYINYVVVGIGINVNQKTMDDSISTIATSLQMVTGTVVSRKALLLLILEEFEGLYEIFLQKQSLGFILRDYNSLCVNVGTDLKIEKRGEISYGQGVEVDIEGRLVIKDSEGNKSVINAGEVSVRGLYGYV